jgi:hypothetical protein
MIEPFGFRDQALHPTGSGAAASLAWLLMLAWLVAIPVLVVVAVVAKLRRAGR